jgi:hypothetical protein
MRILGAAVVALLLAGCAQQAPEVEPVETSTATVEPAEPVAQPAQVFGGDCSAIFSDEALSAALGQQLTRPSPAFMAAFGIQVLEPEAFLEEQAGGVDCAWAAPQEDPTTFTGYVLVVTAVPAGAVTAAESSECAPSDLSATGCPIDVTANGIRLSGLLASDEPGADPLARVAAVEALFTENASAAAAPVVQTSLAGAWQTPTDCSAIAASVDWAALGEPDLEADESLGTDAYASPVQMALRGGRVLYTCWLFGDGRQLVFSLLGGGAWMRDAVLAQDGTTVVDVPGFDLVVERPGPGTIDVFDGVNWLHANDGGDPEAAYPLLSALVDALDTAA